MPEYLTKLSNKNFLRINCSKKSQRNEIIDKKAFCTMFDLTFGSKLPAVQEKKLASYQDQDSKKFFRGQIKKAALPREERKGEFDGASMPCTLSITIPAAELTRLSCKKLTESCTKLYNRTRGWYDLII